MVNGDEKKDEQQQLATGEPAGEAPAESPKPAKGGTKKASGKKGAAKPAAQSDSKQLISFSEYRVVAGRKEVTPVLESGFRVWMQTVKQEPLRSRTFSEWDKLIDEYLKS